MKRPARRRSQHSPRNKFARRAVAARRLLRLSLSAPEVSLLAILDLRIAQYNARINELRGLASTSIAVPVARRENSFLVRGSTSRHQPIRSPALAIGMNQRLERSAFRLGHSMICRCDVL